MKPETPWIIGENGTTIFDSHQHPIVWCQNRIDALMIVLAVNRRYDREVKR
jgi:hypothetical protein